MSDVDARAGTTASTTGPFPPRRILLATDGSQDAELAARAAVDLSTMVGSELHVAHCWQSVPTTRFEALVRSGLRSEARELLEAQEASLRKAGAEVAGAHLREGPAVDGILDLVAELGADLVIMGSRGRGPVGRLILGSVSEGVVHHAGLPVLVMRGGDDAWPPQKVEIGNDGSEAAAHAASLAMGIGGLFGAGGLLIRAYPELPEMDLEGRAFDARMVDDELRREENALEKQARQLKENFGLRPRVRIDVGDPAARLLDAAEERHEAHRTLLAVGSRGLGPVGRVRLGSVSTKLLRAAKGPVLICPSPRARNHEGRHDPQAWDSASHGNGEMEMNQPQQESSTRESRGTVAYAKIMVATDGSDCSTRAAAHAAYLAETLGARLYALYTVDAPRAFHAGVHFREAVAELRKYGAEAVAAVAEMARERGLECEEIVAEGTPHESIILASNRIEADLVVLGSTGMTGLERALIGSVSRKVLLYSERPVLLVREP